MGRPSPAGGPPTLRSRSTGPHGLSSLRNSIRLTSVVPVGGAGVPNMPSAAVLPTRAPLGVVAVRVAVTGRSPEGESASRATFTCAVHVLFGPSRPTGGAVEAAVQPRGAHSRVATSVNAT